MSRGSSGINCLVAIDKPCGMTSHDVVAHVRRAVGEGRVGHAGTLDPDASGVLVIGIGQGTRLMGLLTLDTKRYEARICLGSETTTDDAEGEVTVTRDVPAEAHEGPWAAAALRGLIGSYDQVPPSFSAISVDGRRAYARARAGEEFELPARPVTVSSTGLIDVIEDGKGVCWDCSFEVSKGCYIRAIARDLGRRLGTAAHLSGLRRTGSGDISISDCVSLERLDSEGAPLVSVSMLDPVQALGLPRLELTESLLEDVRCGRRIAWDRSCGVDLSEGGRVSLVRGDKLYGVWCLDHGRLVSQATFPQGIDGIRDKGESTCL